MARGITAASYFNSVRLFFLTLPYHKSGTMAVSLKLVTENAHLYRRLFYLNGANRLIDPACSGGGYTLNIAPSPIF